MLSSHTPNRIPFPVSLLQARIEASRVPDTKPEQGHINLLAGCQERCSFLNLRYNPLGISNSLGAFVRAEPLETIARRSFDTGASMKPIQGRKRKVPGGTFRS
jgi:hypothetical protein